MLSLYAIHDEPIDNICFIRLICAMHQWSNDSCSRGPMAKENAWIIYWENVRIGWLDGRHISFGVRFWAFTSIFSRFRRSRNLEMENNNLPDFFSPLEYKPVKLQSIQYSCQDMVTTFVSNDTQKTNSDFKFSHVFCLNSLNNLISQIANLAYRIDV